jgi:hypothetical protein
MQPEFLFVGGREVREVRKGWQHPKDVRGRYVPLLPFGYPFDEGQDEAPTMPPPLGDVEIAAYETVSEGTRSRRRSPTRPKAASACSTTAPSIAPPSATTGRTPRPGRPSSSAARPSPLTGA